MTDEENLAYETMRAALVAEERAVARLKASLKTAQQDEVHWREYFRACLPIPDDELYSTLMLANAATTADTMLAMHHERWRKS